MVLTELSDDPIIRNHLTALYDTVLEQNLIRIIEPYSRVEISFIAQQVHQPTREVEAKFVSSLYLFGLGEYEEQCKQIKSNDFR